MATLRIGNAYIPVTTDDTEPFVVTLTNPEGTTRAELVIEPGYRLTVGALGAIATAI